MSVEGTATPDDFITVSETITFSSEADTQMVYLTIQDNQIAERDEKLILRLTNAIGGDVSVDRDLTSVTIIDDDGRF